MAETGGTMTRQGGLSRRSMLKRTAAAGAALAWVVPAVEAVGVPKAFAGGTGGTCGSGAPKPWTSLSYVACALRATTGCEPLGVNEGDCFGFKFDFSDDCNDDKPHCDVVTQPKQTPCGDQDALLCSSYHTDSSGEQYYDGFQSGFPPGCGFLTGNGITTNSNLVCNTDGSISFTFPFGSDAPSYEVVGWIAQGASQGGLSPNVALGARSASTAPAGGPALAQTYDPSRTFGAPGPANYSAPSGLFKVSESLTVSPAPAPYVPAPTSYA